MSQLSGNLLTVLITLLLGLSPLQAATVNFSGSFDQREDALQMADAFDSAMTVSYNYAVIQNCGLCNVDDGGFSHNYSSDQCTTCALSIPLIASQPPNPVTTPDVLQSNEGIVIQAVTPLFRPPKI